MFAAALFIGIILYATVVIAVVMSVGFLTLKFLLSFYDYLTEKLIK